jgi:F0F1-type ATP synthase membrane subunit a
MGKNAKAQLALLLFVSLAIALGASALTPHSPHFWHWRTWSHLTFKVFLPSLAWLVTVVYGFARHGWRGLFLLLGTPFALLWPYMFIKLAIECSGRNLPWCD